MSRNSLTGYYPIEWEQFFLTPFNPLWTNLERRVILANKSALLTQRSVFQWTMSPFKAGSYLYLSKSKNSHMTATCLVGCTISSTGLCQLQMQTDWSTIVYEMRFDVYRIYLVKEARYDITPKQLPAFKSAVHEHKLIVYHFKNYIHI